MKYAHNLFLPKNTKFNGRSEQVKRRIKRKSPEVFSGVFGRCKKMSAKFELKPNIQPAFRKKRKVLLASLNQIGGELNNL